MFSIERVIEKAIIYDHGDARRIQHFLKVYAYAMTIGRREALTFKEQRNLETAAVLHDIGIHNAEKNYGSSSGHYQELEGPGPAREILTDLEADESVIERVCYLIAHHHTYHDVKGQDYQILLEADFLVNAYEDNLKKDAIRRFRDNVFRTHTGIKLLNETFGL